MLRRLEVEHLAVLEGLALEFGPGLNVLSGETGAGKSLLLDALQLALGARGDPALIRQGERALHVAALFELDEASAAAERLALLGAAPEEGAVLLSREVPREGRGAARVNGRLVTASVLREIGGHLLTLAGQGEHHRLAQPAAQIDYLDGFAEVQGLRQRVAAAHRAWREAVEAREAAGGDPAERSRRREMLAFAVAEIDALALAPDEEQRLAARRQLLAGAQRLLAAAAAALEALWDGEGAARDRLGEASRELGAAVRLDASLGEVAALVEQAAVAADEAARSLRRYAEGVPVDAAEVAAVEERWNAVQQCKRKYGGSVADVLAFRDRAAAELAAIEAGLERAAGLAAQAQRRGGELAELAAALSRERGRAGARLGAEVAGHLAELGMAGASLQVEVAPRPDPAGLAFGGRFLGVGERGWDAVQMLWAANPGEPAQPLGRAASGGELARLLLVLHALRAESVDVPTLVFDEVDAGVGGRAAAAVAGRLQALAGQRQVLCVTHLAIIAAAADRHFVIEKSPAGGRTATAVRRVDGDERTSEIARMLDGGRGATSRRHASEMLERMARPAGGRAGTAAR